MAKKFDQTATEETIANAATAEQQNQTDHQKEKAAFEQGKTGSFGDPEELAAMGFGLGWLVGAFSGNSKANTTVVEPQPINMGPFDACVDGGEVVAVIEAQAKARKAVEKRQAKRLSKWYKFLRIIFSPFYKAWEKMGDVAATAAVMVHERAKTEKELADKRNQLALEAEEAAYQAKLAAEVALQTKLAGLTAFDRYASELKHVQRQYGDIEGIEALMAEFGVTPLSSVPTSEEEEQA